MPDLDYFITSTQRADLRAPIDKAQTLPRSAFISDDFFQLEIERIFSKQWTALCFAEQVAKGCLLPLEFAGIPLLAVRDDENQLRVFHNIVPYDGCLAVIDPLQDQAEIVTPYHGWCYNLQGKLLKTPYWDGTALGSLAALKQHPGDLIEVHCNVALGIVFINLNGKADALETQLAPLQKQLLAYQTDHLAISRDAQGLPLVDGENLATNWKSHYENWALNVLHEAFTHDIYATSQQIPRVDAQGKKTYEEIIDGTFMALSYRVDDFAETYQLDELPFTPLGKTADSLPERAFIGSLFPNLHMAVFPYFIHFIIVLPVSAGQTKTLTAQFYETNSAQNPEYLDIRLEHQHEFKLAGQEDGRITEAVQKARYSPVYQRQFYSPFWDNMYYTFSNLILNTLEQGEQH